jgi:hypothetical protein
LAKFLAVYPKRVDDFGSERSTAGLPSVSGSKTSSLANGSYIKFGKRRAAVHSSEHEIELRYSQIKKHSKDIFKIFSGCFS